MATALAERDMGQVLKIYQRWTGTSQTQLAQMIDVGQPTISGIMSGKRRVESLALFERFTSGLGIPPERLGLAGTKESARPEGADAGSLPTEGANAVEHGAEYPAKSATAVDLLARLSGADLSNDPALMQSQWSPSAASGLITGFLFGQGLVATPANEDQLKRHGSPADIIRATASHLMDLDFRFGGGHVRKLLLFYFRADVIPLLERHGSGPAGRDVFRAAAEVAELLGWSAYDAGRFGAAQRYYAQALRLAREADDELLGGWMLASLSHQANYLGRYGEALQLARAAASVTRKQPSMTVASHSLAMQARALANLGEAQECARTIHEAEQFFERQDPDRDPAWIAFFNLEELAGEAAHCYRDLGRSQETRLFGAKALHPQHTPPRTQAFIGMVNAAGALNGGDLDEAVLLATETLEIGAPLQSIRYIRYLSDFHRMLKDRYPSELQTAAFSARLREHYPPTSTAAGRA
jgi:transcriptional regulator with XRE-family HTH domain